VYYTFSGAVEIPGAVLPAGQYLFHLADPDSSRQVLQVMSADGKKVYSMFFSLPIHRNDAPNEAEVRLLEAPAGVPPAISTVWYAGETSGRELIYPKDQAKRIAKATNHPVLTTTASTTKADDAKSGDLTRVTPTGGDTALEADAKVDEPTGRSMRETPPATQMAQNDTKPAPVGTAGRSALPKTASRTPALMLIGVALLAAAAGIRVWRTSRL